MGMHNTFQVMLNKASVYLHTTVGVVPRHYVAEGVRLYCQETWKLVTEMKGVQLVEKYIAQVHSITL